MIEYFQETDTLHIEFSDEVSTESEEVYENVIFNFSAGGKIVSITIDPAGGLVDIAKIKPRLKKTA
jgi:uncharacterized protein YuzE